MAMLTTAHPCSLTSWLSASAIAAAADLKGCFFKTSRLPQPRGSLSITS